MAPYGINLMKAFRLDEPKRTLSRQKNGKYFVFLTFIKFSIQGAVILTASAVLSFYFSLRSNSKIIGKFDSTLLQTVYILLVCFPLSSLYSPK